MLQVAKSIIHLATRNWRNNVSTLESQLIGTYCKTEIRIRSVLYLEHLEDAAALIRPNVIVTLPNYSPIVGARYYRWMLTRYDMIERDAMRYESWDRDKRNRVGRT